MTNYFENVLSNEIFDEICNIKESDAGHWFFSYMIGDHYITDSCNALQLLDQLLDNLAAELKDNPSDLVALWDEYCEKVNMPDDEYWSMDDFNEFMYGKEPLDIVNSVDYDFNIDDDYFYMDGYGYFHSTSYPDEQIPVDEIIKYMYDNLAWDTFDSLDLDYQSELSELWTLSERFKELNR